MNRPLCEPKRKLYNDKMLSAFWEELLENGSPMYNEEIDIKIQNYNIKLDMTIPYLLVLFSVKDMQGLSMKNEENLIHCIFRWENTGFFRVSERIFGIAVPMERYREISEVELLCNEYIRFMYEVWNCKISAFMGQPLYMDKLTMHFDEMMELERQIAGAQPRIYKYEDMTKVWDTYKSPNFTLWETLINRGLYSRALNEIRGYLDTWENVKQSALIRFLQDFDRMLYRLEAGGFRELKMVDREYGAAVPGQADEAVYAGRCQSIDSALSYISGELYRLNASSGEHISGQKDAVDMVCAYVRSHMDETMSRRLLAGYVHLNEDYLGRLFRKKMGVSLKDFILREKMAFAAELLEKTSMPVSEVALCVGFRNFAHFSTVFKKLQGMTPSRFRETQS